MFYDQVRIIARSGDGGDGMISFRREKYVSAGGPDGGDGGNGGDIIFVVNPKINSLVNFHKKVHFNATHGTNGTRKKMTGARGTTLRLEVPPGTLIRNFETEELLADLIEPGEEFLAVKGGKGGRGNIHFTSSRNQTPHVGERGDPGEEQILLLELKLIADVGLVGIPNAGKSTLLSVVSDAKPKIASYPFTTLHPNLGVVNVGDYESIVFADIPGLIEGASEGIGLGHEFLRHIERTRILVHLIDGASANPLEDWAMINQELAMYQGDLEKKPQIVVLNKIDLPDAIAWEPIIEEQVVKAGYPFMAISAVTKENVQKLIYKAKEMVDALPVQKLVKEELIVIKPQPVENEFTISRENAGWRLSGKQIERLAAITYWEFDATTERFQRILESSGITRALEDAGVEKGDMVYIGKTALEWGE